MSADQLVVIGGSAGSFEALKSIVRGLSGYEGPVLLVVHVPAAGPSPLPRLLARMGTIAVRHAVDGERLPSATVLVAPPDRHLVLENGRVRLTRAPRENRVRPAADALFRSAAAGYGARVTGVVLSGTLDDGTRGLALIKARGGCTIIQAPGEARFPGMPLSALAHVHIDHVLRARDIAPKLHELARRPPDVTLGSRPLEAGAGGAGVRDEREGPLLRRGARAGSGHGPIAALRASLRLERAIQVLLDLRKVVRFAGDRRVGQ